MQILSQQVWGGALGSAFPTLLAAKTYNLGWEPEGHRVPKGQAHQVEGPGGGPGFPAACMLLLKEHVLLSFPLRWKDLLIEKSEIQTFTGTLLIKC